MTAAFSPPTDPNAPRDALTFSAAQLARALGCSARHVWRLHDAGQLPPAVRIGRLVRWPRKLIEEWIADGCPPARHCPSRCAC